MLPASELTITTLAPGVSSPACTRAETTNTGPIADVRYMRSSASQSGLSNDSLPKKPAETISVSILVDPRADAMTLPADGVPTSTDGIHLMEPGSSGALSCRLVPYTVALGCLL